MKVAVYDTYASAADGRTIHFDVLVPTTTSADTAFEYAQEWLASVKLQDAELKQSRCRFCHTEEANPQVAANIARDGYHIIQMEGCPERG